MRTGVVSLLDEKTAIIAATDDSYKDTTKYCDFYRMNLADGSMELIHPYESSIGISSVGSDSRFGSGQTFKAVNGEFYYVSTVGDFSHLYKISRDGTVSGPSYRRKFLRQLRPRERSYRLHGILRDADRGTLRRRRAGDSYE